MRSATQRVVVQDLARRPELLAPAASTPGAQSMRRLAVPPDHAADAELLPV